MKNIGNKRKNRKKLVRDKLIHRRNKHIQMAKIVREEERMKHKTRTRQTPIVNKREEVLESKMDEPNINVDFDVLNHNLNKLVEMENELIQSEEERQKRRAEGADKEHDEDSVYNQEASLKKALERCRLQDGSND